MLQFSQTPAKQQPNRGFLRTVSYIPDVPISRTAESTEGPLPDVAVAEPSCAHLLLISLSKTLISWSNGLISDHLKMNEGEKCQTLDRFDILTKMLIHSVFFPSSAW